MNTSICENQVSVRHWIRARYVIRSMLGTSGDQARNMDSQGGLRAGRKAGTSTCVSGIIVVIAAPMAYVRSYDPMNDGCADSAEL